ncbi:SH3 domain-containing C40 family peptidase [Clostridium sp. E02]|uniref:C40 family peptidase n=1 Tax=Clostridium sp. E02 TaxID=2487134 RepID=UPI000F534BEF|nr:SH3 domain-containing C40 family peptidase [Clostridium sp. E02]
MECFGIAVKPIVTVWDRPLETKLQKDKGIISAIADELLYGMEVKIIGEETNGFYPVMTWYHYLGYVKKEEIKIVCLSAAVDWENQDLMVTDGMLCDVLSIPSVQGIRLISLPRGALLRVLESEQVGWSKALLLDGCEGYIKNQYLREKEFSQSGLWTGRLPQKKIVDEEVFRKAVTDTAKQYLGTQYRWGGKSSLGMDCSGLTSASYFLSGILIFRDARIEPGYPVHEIRKEEMLPGDLMYFPGHIAMYLGNGSYIHSTGYLGQSGVVINSLDPNKKDYRPDLIKHWYASGSIF